MSGFVETLVASKIHPLAQNEERGDQDKQKRMMKGDKKHEGNTVGIPDNAFDLGWQKTPTMKQLILERLKVPVAVAADMSGEQDVRMVGISMVCSGRPEIILSQPFISSPKACLFTLKEGTKCTVALGSYFPREEPYRFQLEEETLPSGILVRGLYSARNKVMDHEGRCYMDIHYYFNISKTWPPVS